MADSSSIAKHSSRRLRPLVWLLLAAGFLGCDGCDRHAPAQGNLGVIDLRQAPEVSSARPSTVVTSGTNADNQEAKPKWLPPKEMTWVYERTAVGPMHVVVSVPTAEANERFPVLVTMHGRGEAFKGPSRGARGWIDDYWLNRGLARLAHLPLKSTDFMGSVDSERLPRINESLRVDPFAGLIIVMPYTPDVLAGDRPFDAAKPLAAFLVDELLPRVYRETPASGTPATTGIDGVSLGGRAAITVGLQRPRSFGVVGALQAAFDERDAAEIVRRARTAVAENPRLSLRLLTTDRDYFLAANRAISAALSRASVPHRLDVVSGPHDYEFNRGPGLFEMLVFHDRALRGKPPP